MAQDKYKIFAGGKNSNADGSDTSEVLVGFLEKGSSITKGQTAKAHWKRGDCVFPNMSQAWGARVVKAGVIPEKRVQVSDPSYHGEVMWLPYGHEKGYMIDVRYKRASSSLDYQFQILKGGLPPYEKDVENNYIKIFSGLNEYDFSTEKTFIEFLQISHMNENSGSKMPSAEGAMYREVKTFDTKKQQVKEIDLAWECVAVVKDCKTFEDMVALKNILSSVVELTFDAGDETGLYDALTLFAKNKSTEFVKAIQSYDKNVSELIEKGKAYDVFDVSKAGVISITQPEKAILFDGIEGAKGEEMLSWLFDHRMEHQVFSVIEKLNIYSKNFK